MHHCWALECVLAATEYRLMLVLVLVLWMLMIRKWPSHPKISACTIHGLNVDNLVFREESVGVSAEFLFLAVDIEEIGWETLPVFITRAGKAIDR